MRRVWLEDGKVQEYKEGMRLGGERKIGQTLLFGSTDAAAVAEFRIRGGSHIQIDYGMGDCAVERKAPPALIEVMIEVAGKTRKQAFRVTNNKAPATSCTVQQVVAPFALACPADGTYVTLPMAKRGNGEKKLELRLRATVVNAPAHHPSPEPKRIDWGK